MFSRAKNIIKFSPKKIKFNNFSTSTMQTQTDQSNDLTSSLVRMNLDGVPRSHRAEIPGATVKAKEATLKFLEKNDRSFDIFFKESGLHNHLVHHILAAYAFGASTELITQIYEDHASYQRPRLPPQVTITEENWTQHLGRNEYPLTYCALVLWADYLTFFEGIVSRDGITKTFETYGFHPDLFARNFGGALHPIIHIGYGFEFQIPLIIAEGLAQAAIHENRVGKVITKEFLEQQGSNKSILEIVEEMSKNEKLKSYFTYEEKNKTGKLLSNNPEIVQEYAQKWTITETEEGIDKAIKELYHALILVYGATAIRPDKNTTRLEFFLMHGVTSVLFIYLILPHLDLKKRAMLLKGEFAAVLAYYISRGTPKLHLDTLKSYKTKDLVEEPNPWLDIINKALNEKSEAHVIKTIRSLYKAEEVMGPEKDNLYLKIAQLTMDGYKLRDWSQKGLGWDEEWEDDKK